MATQDSDSDSECFISKKDTLAKLNSEYGNNFVAFENGEFIIQDW